MIENIVGWFVVREKNIEWLADSADKLKRYIFTHTLNWALPARPSGYMNMVLGPHILHLIRLCTCNQTTSQIFFAPTHANSPNTRFSKMRFYSSCILSSEYTMYNFHLATNKHGHNVFMVSKCFYVMSNLCPCTKNKFGSFSAVLNLHGTNRYLLAANWIKSANAFYW